MNPVHGFKRNDVFLIDARTRASRGPLAPCCFCVSSDERQAVATGVSRKSSGRIAAQTSDSCGCEGLFPHMSQGQCSRIGVDAPKHFDPYGHERYARGFRVCRFVFPATAPARARRAAVIRRHGPPRRDGRPRHNAGRCTEGVCHWAAVRIKFRGSHSCGPPSCAFATLC